jgi:hypothetical protein
MDIIFRNILWNDSGLLAKRMKRLKRASPVHISGATANTGPGGGFKYFLPHIRRRRICSGSEVLENLRYFALAIKKKSSECSYAYPAA